MSRSSASARARRLLAILHLFEPGTSIPLGSIAEAMGVSASEIAEDLEVLACCGVSPYTPDELLPIYLEGGSIVIWGQLPALDRAVRLSSAEAHALAAALDVAGIADDDPLVTKLLSAAATTDPETALPSLVRASATAEQGDLLKPLTLALERHLLVTIAYQSAGQDGPAERAVEPMALVRERDAWYLEAFCRAAGALRTFRVDRIRSLAVSEKGFEPRKLSPTGSAFNSAGLPLARVHLAPGEEFSARDWPGAQRVESLADASTIVEVPYAGTGWLARQIAARLGGAKVLGPAEVRTAVAELARGAASALR